MRKIEGVFPALITPFTKEGRINEKALQKLIKMNLDKGVAGFYACGSSAEANLLTIDERKYLLELVSDEVKGKCMLIAQIGCISTDQAVGLARHAEKTGVDAISSTPPYYYNFSFSEIRKYYTDIVSSVDVPMIVYNVPIYSGVKLTIRDLTEILSDSRIIGIKHTSMDMYQLERLRSLAGKDITILNGHDEVFLAGLSMGADGAIGTTYNFMAEKFIQIRKLFLENRIPEAQELQMNANGIISALIEAGVLQGTKAVLEVMGIEDHGCRRPFINLNRQEKAEFARKVFELLSE